MLEIILIIWIGRRVAEAAQEKGRSKNWAALGAGFWILGELMGFMVGGALGLGMGSYLLAIGMAAVGAFVAHTVVKALPPLARPSVDPVP
jgi:hypothetical protein